MARRAARSAAQKAASRRNLVKARAAKRSGGKNYFAGANKHGKSSVLIRHGSKVAGKASYIRQYTSRAKPFTDPDLKAARAAKSEYIKFIKGTKIRGR